MYYLNGIVYGNMPVNKIKVSSVKCLDDMIMLIKFNNGETRIFDTTELVGDAFVPLKDNSIFMNPSVDHGVVTWNNGEIDCAPEFLYNHSYEYSDRCC